MQVCFFSLNSFLLYCSLEKTHLHPQDKQIKQIKEVEKGEGCQDSCLLGPYFDRKINKGSYHYGIE